MIVIVVGTSGRAAKFADKLAENKDDIIFSTSKCEKANFVDILPDDIDKIKSFILANEISLLISVDDTETDYAELLCDTECVCFQADYFIRKLSFVPSFGAKFAYKNKIPTSKFASYEKYQAFLDSEIKLPLVIMPDYINFKEAPYIAETKTKAKRRAEELFLTGNRKIFTKEYISGFDFTKYYFIDNSNFLNILDVVSYFDEAATNNTSYLKEKTVLKIENEIMPNILNAIVEEGIETGALFGVNFVIDKIGEPYFANFKTFFSLIDIDIFLNTIEDNLCKLFFDVATGEFFNKNKKPVFNLKTVYTKEVSDEILCSCANTVSLSIKNLEEKMGEKGILKEAISHWKL